MYPAPGKTSSDYQQIADAISDRVALDIVNEHLDVESLEGEQLAKEDIDAEIV